MSANLTLVPEGTTDDTQRAIRAVQYYAYALVLPSICAFGILGNILNLLTLRSPLLQAVSYMYLRALAAADLLCMLFVLEFVIRMAYGQPFNEGHNWYIAHLELPLINVCITCGVLLVVALTVERYISVVFPVSFREWNTARRATTIILAAYVIGTVMYVPMCWEKMTYVPAQTNPNASRLSYRNKDNPAVKDTEWYMAYKWLRELVAKVIPVLTLAYLNIHIIIAFTAVRRRRSAMLATSTRPTATTLAHQQSRDDRRLLVLLASIAVMFFVCNTPAALNLVFIKDKLAHSLLYQTFRACANLLETANHAVNFYVFCMCSKDYRDEFWKRFPLVRVYESIRRRQVRTEARLLKAQSSLGTSHNGTVELPLESRTIVIENYAAAHQLNGSVSYKVGEARPLLMAEDEVVEEVQLRTDVATSEEQLKINDADHVTGETMMRQGSKTSWRERKLTQTSNGFLAGFVETSPEVFL